MDTYGIGLIGWGTVGGGVIELLARDTARLRERCGLELALRTVVTRDPQRARGQRTGATVAKDVRAILDDPQVKCVLHLVGGTTEAKDLMLACLRAGKHVVTANKALIAEHADALFAEAAKHKVAIAFEAAVAGGIPVIAALRDGLVANRIDGIQAILNGTCNYILTRMEEEGCGFAEALAGAQQLGYAEADPILDIDGTDTAHKLAILARIAGMAPVRFDQIEVEGIQAITAADIASARRLGCRIKLLAHAKSRDDGLELHVAPTLVPLDHPLALVKANYNGVYIHADAAGPTLLVGQGAGAHPTASAVIADLVDVASGRYLETVRHFRFFQGGEPVRIVTEDDEVSASYARFAVEDRPGVLAQIARELAERRVSIRSLYQGEAPAGGGALVEVTTHPCRGGDFFAAVEAIDGAGLTRQPTVLLRRV